MSLIFLSHIHEERELAIIIQEAIEEEFSGFVTVFVSSDGKTIPAGSNFLKRIEKGLVDCVAAIYLISPKSVKRNWINFELGAVWIRNHVNELNAGPEIPVIPICHSGIQPSALPMPLTNLNSIVATDASHLKSVFESIQTAVGGKGKLKTDFEILSKKILEFERGYTIDDSIRKLFQSLNMPIDKRKDLINHCKNSQYGKVNVVLGHVSMDTIAFIRQLEKEDLKGVIILETNNIPRLLFTQTEGAVNGMDANFFIDRDLVVKYEELILSL